MPHVSSIALKSVTRALLAASMLTLAGTASAVEWGVAGVLSQQGQRLKVAIPFGSATNLSVVQFRVVRSAAPVGSFSPDPNEFTISKAPGDNFVILQSSELVYANQLDLVVQVMSSPDKAVRYDLRIPGR
ncbi:MAG: hypothetical protein WBD34_03670 [Burkholderiaceae bacterium]